MLSLYENIKVSSISPILTVLMLSLYENIKVSSISPIRTASMLYLFHNKYSQPSLCDHLVAIKLELGQVTRGDKDKNYVSYDVCMVNNCVELLTLKMKEL